MARITVCDQCGVRLDTDILKKKIIQDILPENTYDHKAGKQQFSVDCPVCGAKRIIIEDRTNAEPVAEEPTGPPNPTP